MNANTGQPDTTAFLSSYEKTLHSFSLPERLSGKYTLIDCIRHSSEKEIYLLSDSAGKQYLLKKETASHSSQLNILCDTSVAFDTADGFETPLYVEE